MEAIGSFQDQAIKTRLPREAYFNASRYDEEIERIFRRSWTAIGMGAELPESGYIHPVTILGEPLLITRDKAGVLRVFQNACRHRGVKLVKESGPNKSSKIVCPYHRWWYGFDGGLKGTPYWDKTTGNSRPDGAMMKSLGLRPVRCAVWMDIVFVNLSGDAPPFEDFIAPVEARWSALDRSDLVSIHCSRFELEANWKIVAENFLDFYHIHAVHSAVGGAEDLNEYVDVVLRPDILGCSYPETGHNMGWHDPDNPAPRFASVPSHIKNGMDLLCVLPNALIILTEYYFQAILIYPEGPEHTHETFALYAPAVITDPANRRHLDGLNEILVGVNVQDVPIIELMQAGRRSPASDQIYFAGSWDYIQIAFQERITNVMNGE